MQRYWLSIGDGATYGPYTLDELKAYAADGRVTAASMLCAEGAQQWLPAATVLPGVSLAPPAPPSSGQAAPIARRVQMVWPTVALIASIVISTCLPLGIVAFLMARRANTLYEAGDEPGGQRAESSWRMWAIASWVINLVFAYLTYRTLSSCMSFLDQV